MLRFFVAIWAGVAAIGCGADDADGRGLALRDPAALIDDIQDPLRLLILPSDAFTCDTATGLTAPHPPEERDAAIPEAIVDLTFSKNDDSVMATVAPGDWVILIRGYGTDEVSGRDNFMIATGCQTDSVANQGTKDVVVELIQNFGEGVCGDSILSPDEQCEDGNTTAGDGCTDACRTEPFLVSRTAGMEAAAEMLPAAAWAEGSRLSVVYDSDLGSRDIRMMLFSPSAEPITTPTALSVDGTVHELMGPQSVPSVATGGGRFAVAYGSFAAPATDTGVHVRFLGPDRSPLGPAVQANDSPTIMETDPSIALMPDGTALVVFEDPASGTGLTGRLFASDSTTPASPPFDVGTGRTGSTSPSVAASTTGFVVAFSSGGAIHYQRYGADGAPLDAMAVAVPGAMGDGPAAASLADGRTAIAFTAGFGVQAQVFDAAMTPVGALLDVGAGGEATLAASRDRFAVAFKDGSGIMARMISPDGAFALNRNKPPDTEAFQVAAGSGVSLPSAAAGGTSSDPLWIVTFQDTSADPAGDVRGRLFPLP